MGHGGAVVARGRPLPRRAYSHASRELGGANQVGMRFHIASVSKSFTAAAILLLQQQERVEVHDGVGRFIDGYPNGDRLTLHRLSTHTSRLLALVIEQVSDQSYGACMRQHVFEPLGLEAIGHDTATGALNWTVALGFRALREP